MSQHCIAAPRCWFLLSVSVACVGACGGPTLPGESADAAQQADRQLDGLASKGTLAIDPARCKEADNRLRPFVVSWDPTTQAEFDAHSQQSLLMVKLDGCELTLLPECRIPGEYRMRPTAGGFQDLTVSSEADLYAKLTFSVASLSGELARSKTLNVKYFVRGVRYATAPAVYSGDLPAGCAGASHFVLNYAAGAYELATSARQSAGGSVEVMGQGAGAKAGEAASILFRGGKIDKCDGDNVECSGPVRLRLLPIVEGRAEGEEADARRASLLKPQATKTDHELTKDEIRAVMRTGSRALRTCLEASLETFQGSAAFDTRLVIGADGVVTSVKIEDRQGEPPAPASLRECADQVMWGLRFPASAKGAKVNYPLIFKIAQ